MKILIILFLILTLTNTLLIAQTNWEWQYSTTTEDLNDVHFINENTGWVIGNNGIILNTLDGGEKWHQQNSGTNNKLRAVHFINEDLGWVVGKETMLFTEDGGFNWTKLNQGYIKDISCIFFIDENTGWVCGSDSIILKTSSSGGNWEVIPTKVGKFDDIFFLNESLGWLHSKDDAGFIYMTEDGGRTLLNKSRNRKSFLSFFFLEKNLGWACGGLIDEINRVNGWVDLSTNGADNWTPQYREGLMHSIYFFDNRHGVALGQKSRGILYRKVFDVFLQTIDGGKTWEWSEPGGNAFYFIDKNTGWIVGYRGRIYKTTTGGGLINNLADENIGISDFGLAQNHPNPFNPTTTIGYQLSTVCNVELSVYNLLGQQVVALVSEKQSAGSYQVEWDASGFSGGIYFYQIKTGDYHDIKKMVLLR